MDQEEFLSLDGSRMRAAIAEQTQEFLARGGKITQCPTKDITPNKTAQRFIGEEIHQRTLGENNYQALPSYFEGAND